MKILYATGGYLSCNKLKIKGDKIYIDGTDEFELVEDIKEIVEE